MKKMAVSEKGDSERQSAFVRDQVIYTIGHSNHTMEHLVSILKTHHIEMLIDIRTRPYSSYVPHFNRPDLEKAVINQGIGYVFMGEKLGGYPKDADCYVQDINGKRTPNYNVMAGKDWFREGLDAVIAVSKGKRVVLMCSEEDPNRCHRHHLLSKSLAERGIRVIHIRGDASLEQAAFCPSDKEAQLVDSEQENVLGSGGSKQGSQSKDEDVHHASREELPEDEKYEQLPLFPVGGWV